MKKQMPEGPYTAKMINDRQFQLRAPHPVTQGCEIVMAETVAMGMTVEQHEAFATAVTALPELIDLAELIIMIDAPKSTAGTINSLKLIAAAALKKGKVGQ